MKIQIESVDDMKNLYNEALQDISAYLSTLSKKTSTRRNLAFVLKGVAIFGGIAIGTGLNQTIAQVIGLAITVAIGIDLLGTNQKTLVAYATGETVIKNYLEFLKGKERELKARVIDLQDSGKQQEAEQIQRSFYKKYINDIHTTKNEVMKAVSEADLQALINLAVQPDK